MHHPRYCLTHHPGISSNITKATYFSMPPTPHRPLYPHWCTTHATHASSSSTLAYHPRQHTSIANAQPTLTGLSCKYATYDTHVCTKSIPFLRILGIQLTLKFQEKIQQFSLLFLIYTAFAFQAFLSIFMEVWKTAIEKLNFFRRDQSALFKRRLFLEKQMLIFFRKNCFLILVSFRSFYIL